MDNPRYQLQHLLRTEFERRQERNPSYSLRSFAKQLDVQPSTLSELINGKKMPSSKLAARLLSHLAKDADVSELATLFASEQKRDRYSYTKLELDKFAVIARWHYFAIITLCQSDSLRDDVSGIAQRLALPRATVQEAVDQLVKLGLLEFEGETLRATSNNLAVGDNVLNPAVQAAHAEHLELAREALFELPVTRREFISVNVATHSSEMKVASKRLTAFLRGLARDLETSNSKDTVYRIGIQMFPLTVEGDTH